MARNINSLRSLIKKVDNKVNAVSASSDTVVVTNKINEVSSSLFNLSGALEGKFANKINVYTRNEIDDKGFLNNLQVDNLVTGKGYLNNLAVNNLLDTKGFLDTAGVDSLVNAKGFLDTAGVNGLVDGKGFRTAAQVAEDISTNANVTALKDFKDGIVNGTSIPTALSNKFADITNVYSKTEVDNKGFLNSSGVDSLIGTKGFLNTTQVNNLVDAKGFLDTTGVNSLVDGKGFRTAGQVASDIGSFNFGAGANTSFNNALNAKANTTDVNTALSAKANASDVTTALSLKANSSDVDTALAAKASLTYVDTNFRTAAQVSNDIAANPNITSFNSFKTGIENGTSIPTSLTNKFADATTVYTKNQVDNFGFQNSAGVSGLIGSYNFEGGGNSSFTTALSAKTSNTDFNSYKTANDTKVLNIQTHTASINSFSSSHGYKLSNFAFSDSEESNFKFASLSTSLKSLFSIAYFDPTSGIDQGKWYYTNLLPNGSADYKLSSYSYQGYGTVGGVTRDWYNKEEFIGYRKRIYNVGTGGTNGAYTSTIYQDSELRLQAGRVYIQNGTTNNTNPTLNVIGEVNTSLGVGIDQGQLYIQDEDDTNAGLLLGYSSAGTAGSKIQSRLNNSFAADLYLNGSGGNVYIGNLSNAIYLRGQLNLNGTLAYHQVDGTAFIVSNNSSHAGTFTDNKLGLGISGGNPQTTFHINKGSGAGSGNDIMRLQGEDVWHSYFNGAGARTAWVGFGAGPSTNLFSITNTKSGGQIHIGNGKISVGSDSPPTKFSFVGGNTLASGFSINNADVHTIFTNEGGSSNAGKIQVKSGGNTASLGSNNYDLRLNPDGGNVYVNATLVSDLRTKYDIKDSDLGLEFINKIKPVSYKVKVRETLYITGSDGKEVTTELQGVRPHYGFIAQQIKESMGEKDFAGYIYNSTIDEHALRYHEFIAPMTKAIQELSAENNSLKAKLAEKDSQIADIVARLNALENKN